MLCLIYTDRHIKYLCSGLVVMFVDGYVSRLIEAVKVLADMYTDTTRSMREHCSYDLQT